MLFRQSIYQPWLMLAHLLMINIYLLKKVATSLTRSFCKSFVPHYGLFSYLLQTTLPLLLLIVNTTQSKSTSGISDLTSPP